MNGLALHASGVRPGSAKRKEKERRNAGFGVFSASARESEFCTRAAEHGKSGIPVPSVDLVRTLERYPETCGVVLSTIEDAENGRFYGMGTANRLTDG